MSYSNPNFRTDRIGFDDTIIDIEFSAKTFPVLEAESVRDMENLKSIRFHNCELDAVEPGAFRNVPMLSLVNIRSCNLRSIHKGVFNSLENLEIVRLQGNEIIYIEDHSFANLSLLKEIDVSANNLTYWRSEWFRNSPSIENMYFSDNKISTIPKKAFVSSKKLKLGIVNLSQNRLKIINEDIFPNPIGINELSIYGNYLNFLSTELLKKLTIKDFYIDLNPWKCSCLDRIHYWMFTSNLTFKIIPFCNRGFIPVCAVPTTYSQSCLEYVDDDLTGKYIDVLRNMHDSNVEQCARLD
ncbi:hypothetical protein JTB14_012004 [Gonioctena quinquepunctata]|nr:hypothetical protein JTB14_012004 [Gonioctena quinquepunctata]